MKSLQSQYLRTKSFIELLGIRQVEIVGDRLECDLKKLNEGNTKYYDGITRFLNTPFDKVIKKESEWSYYANYLEKEINCAVFSELCSLQQIYIPLRGYYKKKSKKEDSVNTSKDERNREKAEKIVVDLEEEILSWLKKSDKDDAIRVIRGGPGYGKSSFMKMLAAKLSSQNHHVIFVPLHRFEVKDDMVDAIHNFLKYDSYLTFDPFEEEQLILVFDGLDELSMQGKILGEVANRFVGEVGEYALVEVV